MDNTHNIQGLVSLICLPFANSCTASHSVTAKLVQWALYVLFKIVKSLMRHLGLAIGNFRHVRWFWWTLQPVTGIILVMGSANERWCYNEAFSLIGSVHTENDPWIRSYFRICCQLALTLNRIVLARWILWLFHWACCYIPSGKILKSMSKWAMCTQ